jgi:hypothetical protein
MGDDEIPPGGAEVGGDPPWDAWHPREVAGRLAGVDVRWCVAAGWALDLFRGEVTREHEDLEIAVPAGQFGRVRAVLADFDIEVVGSGRRWPLDSPAFDVMIQTWVRERDTGYTGSISSGSPMTATRGSAAATGASGCLMSRSS